MKKYQYQIVRYIHDRVTSEFVNVGIVVFAKKEGFLHSKFISKYSRISNFFSDINGSQIISTLKNFEKEVDRYSNELKGLFFDPSSIEEITQKILPKDDSALECSEVFLGIDINLDSALNGLYNRQIRKYIVDTEKDVKTDGEVWKNFYKEYFDKYNITKRLTTHLVKTKNDVIEFDKAWKNGSWHCYQTLSFDLKKTESIKNKVYKWSGIVNELENSKELLHLYLLTEESSKHQDLNKFIKDTFKNRSNDLVKISVIKQQDADKFAKKVLAELESHDNYK